MYAKLYITKEEAMKQIAQCETNIAIYQSIIELQPDKEHHWQQWINFETELMARYESTLLTLTQKVG